MAQTSDRTLAEIRRDLHAHAESGWREFRTTGLVAEELDDRGFELSLGADALNVEGRMGVPPEDEIEAARERALSEGAPETYLDRMGEITGLVAVKEYGSGDGPVVGVRVDLDALDRSEARDDDHRPAREGFASIHPNETHACGHDGHTAIGLGIARELDAEGGFDGTLKLFFQPAEEGDRGGKPMSETDHLADVEYLIALHLGLGLETGTVVAGYERPLATSKFEVTFAGEPAHAGGDPEKGRNALQALSTAVTNLYAIPRHSGGATRVNVGMVHSANPQNVIAEEATMRLETRGETAELNEYMESRARRVVEAAAAMHDCSVEVETIGYGTSFVADDGAVEAVAGAARSAPGVTEVVERRDFGGSEDASFLIRRVQEEGGEATYVGIGASNVAGHHTERFDFDEDALGIGVDVVARAIRSLG